MLSRPTKGYIPRLIDGNYVFVTDDGRIYEVSFEEQPFVDRNEFRLADHVFEVFLTLQKAPPSYSADPRIGVTLTAIVRDFIDKDARRIIFYTCDTADGRHLARYRRFNEWFFENSQSGHIKLEEKIFYQAIDREFLISVIVSLDHPYADEVLPALVRVVKRLRAQR